MKRSKITQELINIYPPWAEVRNDQSTGYQFLNVMAQPLEQMEKSLIRMQSNTYLMSANIDEIDLTYKVALPTNFEFDTNTLDASKITYIVPTVSGLIDGHWYPVQNSLANTIQDFWYNSLPNRVSIDDTISGVTHELISMPASGLSAQGEWSHHLDGGHIWVECIGGTEYLYRDDNNLIRRGRVVLKGLNRLGQEVDDVIVFPWDMKQKSNKEWSLLTNVNIFDVPDTAEVIVTSANFNAEDRLAPHNISLSPNRNKIDTFYSLGILDEGSTLDHIGYITDEWQQLLLGFVDKEPKERWELIDSDLNTISGIDIALQPFTDLAWVITEDHQLYCFDTNSEMLNDPSLLIGKTPGSNVKLDIQNRRVLLGEPIEIIPWHARPIKEILRYRIWYQDPLGAKYGILNGIPVNFESDFWVTGYQLKRTIADYFEVIASLRGEYLFVIEAEFIDNEIHTDKVVVKVQYKQPLAHLDISSLISDSVIGLDFDSDQRLWILTADKYYQIGFHTDIMLIDYEQKLIYFREPYEEVGIETNG